MGQLHDWLAEWKARRAGARYLSHDIGRSARHIIGPTGNGFSNAWDRLAESGDQYLQSFDPRVPPSIHVSQRDRTRWNMPIPLPERCIEDWRSGDSETDSP